MRRDVYSGWLKRFGEEHGQTLREASNYATSLADLKRFEEAKVLLRKWIPVARRVLGEDAQLTLTMRWTYAEALYVDDRATLDDLHEAVTALEDTVRIARQVFGGAHAMVRSMGAHLRDAQAALVAHDTPSSGSS